jgi:2-dehydro-3-deoxyglucarate aldolase
MNRLSRIESIRAKLRGGGVTVGSWMQIPHASVAELMGQAGYEWVAVDLEHGAVSRHQLPDLFRALELNDTLPLARVAQGDAMQCKTALDAGAGGVIIPMIESAGQLATLVNACRWPPAGTRGVGFSRANLFGQHFAAYAQEAQQPLVIAQIEHVRAVAELQSILRVPGLDAIMVGPYDLSASMGLTGEFEAPRFKETLATIRSTADAALIASGVHVVEPSAQALARAIESGFRFIAYSIDAVFLQKSARLPEVGAVRDE